MAPARRRFPWRVYVWVLIVIILVALGPLIGVVVAGGIASANGCTLHEGFANPCVVVGVDMGGLLYGLGVLGWLMLASIPLGAMALLGWALVLGLHHWRWRVAGRLGVS